MGRRLSRLGFLGCKSIVLGSLRHFFAAGAERGDVV